MDPITALRALLCALALGLTAAHSGAASAQALPEWLSLEGAYHGDSFAFDGGPDRRGSGYMDLLSIVGEADLTRISPGLLAHLHVENTSGGEPNDRLGTARGFDNIEVGRQRLRLYEAWVEKSFGAASVLVGFYDFNSEFNATEAAGLFIGPGFGISTEISGATAGGPSIFPSTGLGARGRWQAEGKGYVQAAVINSSVGVLGDPGGADFEFANGVLVAGEAGLTARSARIALGGWRYSKPLPESLSTSPDDHTHGAYVLLEQRLGGEDGPGTVFLRAGVSDGATGDFSGGLQAGFTLAPALSSRPDSAFGIGLDYVGFSSLYRESVLADGLRPSRGEAGLEVTYADRLLGPVLVQPNLQLIFNPEGDRDRPVAGVATLRVTVEF